jgi:transcriptional regulator with XRE-family HTH domain
MASHLNNYLRTYRKRTGLSQQDVAFLLGCEGRGAVSRYERFTRQPSLPALCAYEMILGARAQELFAGVYDKVAHDIAGRAELLARRLSPAIPAQLRNRKLEALRRIASGSAPQPVHMNA